MSSTFSTVVNFGMLGLLRRLDHMQIQMTLEGNLVQHNTPSPEGNFYGYVYIDIETRTIIDKFVARNCPEFEAMTKKTYIL